MPSPKTTVAGYVALAGTVMIFLGDQFKTKPWGQLLYSIGLVFSGVGTTSGLHMAKDNK